MSNEQDALSSTTINRIITNNYIVLKREQQTALASIFAGLFCLFVVILFADFVINFPDIRSLDERFLSISIVAVMILGGVGLWLILWNGFITGWHLFNRKKLYEILLIQSLVIRRSYLINFDLVEPYGKDRLEKIFNHLCMVFPQINEIKEKKEKKNENYLDYYKVTSRRRRFSVYKEFQLVLRTSMGLFLIKAVDDKITLEDIEKVIKKLNHNQFYSKIFGGMDLFRVVIVTNQFNKEYNTQKFKEKLAKIPRKFAIDIIFEDEYGYSTISID